MNNKSVSNRAGRLLVSFCLAGMALAIIAWVACSPVQAQQPRKMSGDYARRFYDSHRSNLAQQLSKDSHRGSGAQQLPEVAGNYAIQVIDPPSGTGPIYAVFANQNGMLVMQYGTVGTESQGHTALLENGVWTIIDVPNSDWTGTGNANASGWIPMPYGDAAGYHNALYHRGKYTPLPEYLAPPGQTPYQYFVQLINDRFDMTGIAFDPNSDCTDSLGPCMQGVLLNTSLSLFKIFHPPGAVSTYPMGLNNANKIVGGYQNSTGEYHAFFSDEGKTFINVDPPDSANSPVDGAWSINDNMEICGTYFNTSSVQQGFLLREGIFSVFNIPNSLSTSLMFITNNGQLSGFYVDLDGISHPFIATPKPGRK